MKKAINLRFRYSGGFTLTELMFVVAIAALIGIIAVPSYLDQVRKGKRSEGKGALVDLANRMEKYYYDNRTYATATLAAVLPGGSTSEPNGYYQLTLATLNANDYVLHAAPAGNFTDPDCRTLTLSSTGLKGVAGGGTLSADECW